MSWTTQEGIDLSKDYVLGGGQIGDDWWQNADLVERPDFVNWMGEQGYKGPEWAFYPGSGFTNLNELITTYAGMDPRIRDSFLGNLRSDYDRWQREEAAYQAQLGTAQNTRDMLTSAYESWQADPYRTAAMDNLLAMSQPGYSVVPLEQQTAMHNELAQQRAMQRAIADATAAGRGISGGGAHTGRNAMIDAATRAGGLQLDASIATANEAARRDANTLLGKFAGGNESIDMAYQAALNRVNEMEAAYEGGYQIEPTDFAVWDTLDLAFQELDQQTKFQNEAIQEYKDSQKWDWDKFVDDLLLMQGTGMLKPVLRLFS